MIFFIFSFNYLLFFIWNFFCLLFFIHLNSCQDRIGAVVNIAIDLLSYLLNLCASFGWQSAHTIYCVKFIRINRRALMQQLKSIRFLEHIKTIGLVTIFNGKSNSLIQFIFINYVTTIQIY